MATDTSIPPDFVRNVGACAQTLAEDICEGTDFNLDNIKFRVQYAIKRLRDEGEELRPIDPRQRAHWFAWPEVLRILDSLKKTQGDPSGYRALSVTDRDRVLARIAEVREDVEQSITFQHATTDADEARREAEREVLDANRKAIERRMRAKLAHYRAFAAKWDDRAGVDSGSHFTWLLMTPAEMRAEDEKERRDLKVVHKKIRRCAKDAATIYARARTPARRRLMRSKMSAQLWRDCQPLLRAMIRSAPTYRAKNRITKALRSLDATFVENYFAVEAEAAADAPDAPDAPDASPRPAPTTYPRARGCGPPVHNGTNRVASALR
ncbi:MAG: hypothetical protein ACYTFD_09715, partial [Planctomycetota bacterium]